MAIESRIKELTNRHRDLDNEINQEFKNPSCDDLHLANLKKKKLKIKEEIESLIIKIETNVKSI